MAPSLLSADFTRLGDAVRLVERSGGDWIHLDVMDGAFVPNIGFGPKMVADIRPLTRLPFDIHLMTHAPELIIHEYVDAGADHITFHIEGNLHVNRTIHLVRSLGRRAGVSVVPSTPIGALSEILSLLDIVLVMTVNPGVGGEEFIRECIDKVRALDATRRERGYRYQIAADGGINRENCHSLRDAGADVLIVGRSFFASPAPARDILTLKGRTP